MAIVFDCYQVSQVDGLVQTVWEAADLPAEAIAEFCPVQAVEGDNEAWIDLSSAIEAMLVPVADVAPSPFAMDAHADTGPVMSGSARISVGVDIQADTGPAAFCAATFDASASGAGTFILGWQATGGEELSAYSHESLLKRLLGYLYGSFDKESGRLLALRVGHIAGLVWQVQGRVLSLRTFAGAEVGDIDLVGITMDDLADRLTIMGCEVRYRNPALSSRLADALLDGRGQEWSTNGDHLYCYDSTLWALADAYAIELERALVSLDAALREAYLDTASGVWLDLWGGYFGIPRWSAETDGDYLVRMIVEVLRPRNNAMAIEQTIKAVDGVRVSLREPWKEIFTLDESALSGGHKLHDGSFWTWTVFQPILHDYVPMSRVARVAATIERNRPAGVLPVHPFAQPAIKFADRGQAVGGGASLAAVRRGAVMAMTPGVLSDNLNLSDMDAQVPLSVQFAFDGSITIGGYATYGRFDGPATWDAHTWGRYSWVSRFTNVAIALS